MMKWMIASDLHGSYYFTKKLWERFEAEKADRLILLGDLLYHGPRNDLPKEYAPKEVMTFLNERAAKLLCVKGNCDADVDQMVLSFPIMASYAVIPAGKHLLYLTHGDKFHAEALPPLSDGDFLIYGHTHVPMCKECSLSTQAGSGTVICMNPGSVSLPKEESPHSYMIWDENAFIWKDLDGKEFLSYNI